MFWITVLAGKKPTSLEPSEFCTQSRPEQIMDHRK